MKKVLLMLFMSMLCLGVFAEKDVTVKRFTLPYYIGRSAIGLFAGLYLLTYVVNIIMVVIRIFPPASLLALLSVIPVWKNIKIFIEKQSKEETFILVAKVLHWVTPNFYKINWKSYYFLEKGIPREILRTLEQHVFKEVGKTGLSRFLSA